MFKGIKQTLIKSLAPTLIMTLFALSGDSGHEGSGGVVGGVSAFMAFYLLTCVLGVISASVRWRLGARTATLFVLIFGVMTLGTGIELQIFSTTEAETISLYFVNGLWQQAIYAFVIAWHFRPDQEEAFEGAFRRHWMQRTPVQWFLRIALAMFLYILLYFVVGAVAYQFTGPYYNDLSNGLELTIPGLDLILQVQVLRSFLYVLSLSSVIAGFAGSKKRLAFLAGTVLFMLGGFTPLLAQQEWPAALRFYHTVEILLQNFPAGWIMVYLLKPSGIPEEQGLEHALMADTL